MQSFQRTVCFIRMPECLHLMSKHNLCMSHLQDMAHAQERIGGVTSTAVANAEDPRIRREVYLYQNFQDTYANSEFCVLIQKNSGV